LEPAGAVTPAGFVIIRDSIISPKHHNLTNSLLLCRLMQPWKQAPIIRIALPFIAGIISAFNGAGLSINTCIYVGLVFTFLFTLIQLYLKQISFKYRWLPGLVMSIALFFMGSALMLNRQLNNRPDFFASHLLTNDEIVLRLDEPLKEKANSYKTVGNVKALLKKGQSVPASGKVLLYFAKSEKSANLKYGDVIILQSIPMPIRGPANPGEFDFRHYMATQNIYHSAFIKKDDFIYTGVNKANVLWRLMYSAQYRWGEYFKESIGGKNEQSIARALVLGDVSDINTEVISDYAASGTLHVLSVSGLHIGAIFLVLNFLFRYLQQFRAGKIIRILLLLSLLWAYALLTGLSPAVCRSVAMFSFIVIGKDFRKITSIYNSIATSAIALLLWDPFMIAQPGFQLSYIALIGIVWIYPSIYGLWEPAAKLEALQRNARLPGRLTKNTGYYFNFKVRQALIWLIKGAWGITSMSMAAQLATFPLGLYYFNQFPIYFLISNLLIIPWSTIILFSGCFFLIVRLLQFSWLFKISGKILFWLIHGMNFFVRIEHNLPASQIKGLHISSEECVLIYILLFCLVAATIYRHKNFLKTGIALCLLFFAQRGIATAVSLSKREIIIHNIPRAFAISVRGGSSLYFLGDSTMNNDKNKCEYYVNNYAYKNFITKGNIHFMPLKDTILRDLYFNSGLLRAGRLKILIVHSIQDINTVQKMADIDVVVLDRNPHIKLKDLIAKYNFPKLVITTSNSMYRANNWEKECQEAGIECINYKRDNSLVIEE
jgi:competence protein ComEC